MKVFTVIMKVLAVLAAVAGAVYLAATYGDKVVAWAKKLLGRNCCCGHCDGECECEGECQCECCDCEEAPAEEAPAEEAPAEEAAEEPAEEADVVAAEGDFEG